MSFGPGAYFIGCNLIKLGVATSGATCRTVRDYFVSYSM